MIIKKGPFSEIRKKGDLTRRRPSARQARALIKTEPNITFEMF